MNYCGLNTFDMVNTDSGIHISLFVSGCSLKCKGCFNQEAWDKDYGKPFTEETKKVIFDNLRNPYISGLSILGGDPLEAYNYPEVLELVKAVKEEFGTSKYVWLWTGRRFKKIMHLEIIKYLDVIITNPFIEKKKITGELYGSSNQRVIKLFRNSGELERFARPDSYETELE